jgi:hypothetical protein
MEIPDKPVHPRVLTLSEAARILRTTPRILKEQCRKGCFPGRKIGGSWVILEESLLNWLREPEAVCPSFGVEKSGGSILLPPRATEFGSLAEHIRKNSRKSTTTHSRPTSGSREKQ